MNGKNVSILLNMKRASNIYQAMEACCFVDGIAYGGIIGLPS